MSLTNSRQRRGNDPSRISGNNPDLRVQLIECNQDRSELTEPIAIELLAAILDTEDGVSTNLVSHQFGEMEALAEERPHLVGVSVSIGSYSSFSTLVQFARKLSHSPVIVAGKLQPTYAAAELIAQHPDIICVRGEGEDAILGLVRVMKTCSDPMEIRQELKRREVPNLVFLLNGELVETPRERVDLSKQPHPYRKYLKQTIERGGIIEVEASRGCEWSVCTFCTVREKFSGRVWRPFPIEHVVEELIEISEAGGKHLFFTDEDFFGGDFARSTALASRIIQEKREGKIRRDLTYFVSAKAKDIVKMNPSVLRKWKNAGMSVVYLGWESLSNRQLRRYGKGITQRENIRAHAILSKMGFIVDLGFIMFDPEVTLEDLQENVDGILAAGVQDHDARLVKSLRVTPCSAIKTRLERTGHLTGPLDLNSLMYPYRFQNRSVERIYRAFVEWEDGMKNFLYRMQEISRAGNVSEQKRRKILRVLSMFRSIDYEYLQACIEIARDGTFESELPKITQVFFGERDVLYRWCQKEEYL